MPILFWRFREYLVLGLAMVASVVFMALGETDRVESARRVRTVVFYPLEKTLRFWDRYAGLEEENRILRLKVSRLVEETGRLQDAKAENERLRRMLGFRERGYRKMVLAEVIGWDESSIGLNLEIDQGEQSGIGQGDPVVSVDGLVGKVVRVYPQTAWVTTLRSPDCAVSALDQRSRVRGIVRWRHPKGLTLQWAPAGADLAGGDVIISSGLGGVFPKGLRIGTVKEAGSRVGDLHMTVTVRSFTDFDRLEEVAVLSGETEGSSVDSSGTAGTREREGRQGEWIRTPEAADDAN